MEDFSEEGLLAQTIKGFKLREPQKIMASAVTAAINEKSHLIIEAGTGTGKTFAYLVPALRSGKKVIISTGSKNLQDQLFCKDLPLIKEALTYSGKTALLKGRSNYLCLERLKNNYLTGGDLLSEARSEVIKIKEWSVKTSDGDISKCIAVTEDNAIWPTITSTNDNCLGSDCAHYEDCYVIKARRRALQADIIIVNHHLFFADIVVKDSGFGELIPKADAVIFDEAHQLPDLASQYFGYQLSNRQLIFLSKEMVQVFRTEIKDMVQLQKCAAKLEMIAQEGRSVFGGVGNKGELKTALKNRYINAYMQRLLEALHFCREVLELAFGRNKTLDNCLERINNYTGLLERLFRCDETGFSAVFDCADKYVRFSLIPLSVSERFASLLNEPKKGWIFTSATLSIDHKLDYFTQRLGLSKAKSLLLSSPFDYQNQTLLCVPRYIPFPHDSTNAIKLIEILLPIIEANEGRCFCLCTSYLMMNALSQAFRLMTHLPILVQGETSKTQLLTSFIEKGNAVLIATNSFWEGIDVKGEVLSCVIIDKLPFIPPDDPLIKARMETCVKEGGDPFFEIQIPEAVIALKQGVGRLIRDHDDRGVIIICDNRLVTRPYGAIFLNSLPPSPRTRDTEYVIRFLKKEK